MRSKTTALAEPLIRDTPSGGTCRHCGLPLNRNGLPVVLHGESKWCGQCRLEEGGPRCAILSSLTPEPAKPEYIRAPKDPTEIRTLVEWEWIPEVRERYDQQLAAARTWLQANTHAVEYKKPFLFVPHTSPLAKRGTVRQLAECGVKVRVKIVRRLQ